MKQLVKKTVCFMLIHALALSVWVAAEESVLDTSLIDTQALPCYVEGAQAVQSGEVQRLAKYDTAEHLNVVGFTAASGNELVYLYPYDIKYIKNNQLIDKDISLQPAAASLQKQGYAVINTANRFKLCFPEDIAEAPGLIQLENHSIALQPKTDEKTVAALKNDENCVIYSDAFGENSELSLQSDYAGMNLAACIKPVDVKGKISIRLTTKGYVLSLLENGCIEATGQQNQETEFTMLPFEIESNKGAGGFCTMSLTALAENEYELTAFLPVELTDSSQSVTVTSSITEVRPSVIADAPVYSKVVVNMGAFKYSVVGAHSSSSYGVGRLYVKFNLSSLNGISYDRILSAHYSVPFNTDSSYTLDSKMEAYLVKDDWSETAITWENRPDYFNEHLCVVNSSWDSSIVDDDTSKSDFYITAAVQAWLQGVPNYGIVIKERNDAGTVTYATREHSTRHPYLAVLVASESAPTEGSGVAAGTYYLKSKINNMYMTAQQATSGSAVVQKKLQTDRAGQIWQLTYAGNGDYTLSPNNNTSLALRSATNLKVSNNTKTSVFMWKIRRNWDGSYSLLSKSSNYVKTASVGVNYSAENMNLIQDTDSMGLRKYDDWTLIPAEKGTASLFGFDTSTRNIDIIQTEGYVQETDSRLKLLGYETNMYINKTASFALSQMASSRLFMYYGHGNAGYLAFVFENPNGSLNETALTGSSTGYMPGVATIQSIASNGLSHQMLTLYDACLAGRMLPASNAGNDALSLTGMTYFRGSHYVISFTNVTTNDSTGYFVEYFYTSLRNGKTVYQALLDLQNHVTEYINANGLQGIPNSYYEKMFYYYCLGDNSLVYNF